MGTGKHRAVSPQRQRMGSLVAVGTAPLVISLIGSGTAAADSAPPPAAAQPPPVEAPAPRAAPAPQPDPVAMVQAAAAPVTQVATELATRAGLAPPAPAGNPLAALSSEVEPGVTPAHPAADVPGADSAARPVPDQAYLAPLGELHAPTPVEQVAPITPPEDALRIGNLVMNAPGFDPTAINEGAAQAEADLATYLDSVGLERSRSDKIAAQTVGSAAIGASVGGTVAAPLAATSATVGAVAGLVSGIPFLPIGLVAGPILGAAIGYSVIAAPAAAAGAGIGAGIGAVDGFTAAPYGTAPTETAPAETPAIPS